MFSFKCHFNFCTRPFACNAFARCIPHGFVTQETRLYEHNMTLRQNAQARQFADAKKAHRAGTSTLPYLWRHLVCRDIAMEEHYPND